MKFVFYLITLSFIACSHQANKKPIAIASADKGIYKNANLSIPLFITSKIETEKTNENILKIHQGHFLSMKNSREQNVGVLKSLEEANFHLINLTLEDIAISEIQEIQLQDFKRLIFLNSTIFDINSNNLYGIENVQPYFIFEDVVFIGLSDQLIDPEINKDRFLISDYVLAILKIKKMTKDKNIKSYVLIHRLGNEINEIMNRLPPTFSDSLAN